MKQNEELQLANNFLSDSSNDGADIAEELSRELGEVAEVRLTTPETPAKPTRSVAPGLVMQMISVSFAGIGILIQLAKLLLDISKKKSGVKCEGMKCKGEKMERARNHRSPYVEGGGAGRM